MGRIFTPRKCSFIFDKACQVELGWPATEVSLVGGGARQPACHVVSTGSRSAGEAGFGLTHSPAEQTSCSFRAKQDLVRDEFNMLLACFAIPQSFSVCETDWGQHTENSQPLVFSINATCGWCRVMLRLGAGNSPQVS